MNKQNKDLIVTYNTEHGEVKLSPGIIRKYLASDKVTDQEVVLFMKLCQFQKLNPFLKEAYLIKYSDNYPATMVVGKETFTKRAGNHKEFDGFKAGVCIMKADNVLEKREGTLVLDNEDLVGGWAEVHRKDKKIPFKQTVSLYEYEGRKNDGALNKQWSGKPATMIRKVALVQCLREAFPEKLQGLYDETEMNETKEKIDSKENLDTLKNQITELLKNDVFTNDDRQAVALSIKDMDYIQGLEAIKATWEAKLERPKQDIEDAEIVKEPDEKKTKKTEQGELEIF
jgi:phage recombination protein Bet